MNPVRRSRHERPQVQTLLNPSVKGDITKGPNLQRGNPQGGWTRAAMATAARQIAGICQNQDSPVQMAEDVEETKFSETPDIALELGEGLVQDIL